MTYSTVSVFGAGAMGSGMAYVLAAASKDVVLIDVSAALVAQGAKKIEATCASAVKRGRLTPEEKDALMGRVRTSTAAEDAASSDLVIEAIIEDRTIKGDLFRSLHALCPPDAVFATNTSTLSVTDLASLSGRPDRFLGLHFFNPVPAMKLVEVIPGLDTAPSVVSAAQETMAALGKIPVTAQDCPGFLVNRILLAYITETLLCVEEGVSPEEILGVLRAVAPQVGGPRVIAAAPEIMIGLGLSLPETDE